MRPGGLAGSVSRFAAAQRKNNDPVAKRHAVRLARHGIEAKVALPMARELRDLAGHYRRQLVATQRAEAEAHRDGEAMRLKLDAVERELARAESSDAAITEYYTDRAKGRVS
jgi:hypothetical protein